MNPVFVGSGHERHVIEHKNSAWRPDMIVSPMPVGLQVGLGLLGGAARVAVVGLAGRGSRMSQTIDIVAAE
jgi:hypothetical protein